MRRVLSFKGDISPLSYAVLAPALLLSQHLAVALAFETSGFALQYDLEFWLLPLRRLISLPSLSPWATALAFIFSLFVAYCLALLSYRRATYAGAYGVAAFSVVPVIQVAAVSMLMFMPVRRSDREPELELEPEAGMNVLHVLQGLLAGMAIIVLAVLVSAVTFGAYGWGLFVLTPLLVGITTGYLANREVALESGRTFPLVMAATGLGGLALVMLALEGIACIIMAAPLALLVAAFGGWLGREAALTRHRRGTPLMSLALLPAVFALEAAMPPAVPIEMHQTIDISAPPTVVWQALTSSDPILPPPGLVGRAGLAYPIRGRLLGMGVGETRLGEFSTGVARERITDWAPGRLLGFTVVSQPPAMKEMSPYRRVHAPHVSGYFDTTTTSYQLKGVPGGGTQLTVRTTHMLRLDPVLYWEPIARWAIHETTSRVLRDIKGKAEASPANGA